MHPSTRTATLTPTASLAAGATYTVTVKGGTGGVRDLAGNPMSVDDVWSFTTLAAAATIVGLPATSAEGTPLVILAGKEYGTGSSRDWAAKGTNLLGVRAVIAESFERIHRSNLVGMGIVPLQFADGVDRKSLKLDGSETFTIENVAGLRPRQDVTVTLTRADGTVETFQTRCRIDTVNELEYFLNGGILHYVLRKLAA